MERKKIYHRSFQKITDMNFKVGSVHGNRSDFPVTYTIDDF
ncbi:hypothetical protein [Christiangramia gaetbulicola]|nr:hypothetical protein [Christiangramia gaetbulicola]